MFEELLPLVVPFFTWDEKFEVAWTLQLPRPDCRGKVSEKATLRLGG